MSIAVTLSSGASRSSKHAKLEDLGTFEDQTSDFCADAGLWEAVFYGDNSMGFLNALDDSGSVQGFDAPQVDDLGFDAFLRKLLRSQQRKLHVSAVSDDGDVLAWPHDLRFADGCEEVVAERLLGDIESLTIKIFVFQKYNWIVSSNGRFQQSPTILRIVRAKGNKARNGSVP